MINMKRCNMSLERLASIGVDVDEAMDRFMNNEMMCIKFFKKLLNDDNFALLQEAFKTHDLDNAIAYAHTLKGVCGNLAIKPLYHIFDEMVKALRNDDWEHAKKLDDQAKLIYEQLITIIKMMA